MMPPRVRLRAIKGIRAMSRGEPVDRGHAESSGGGWDRLRPTIALAVALPVVAAIWFWWDDVHRWVRDEDNASEILALAAAAQVIFAAALAWLTWRSNRTAQRVAEQARQLAEEEGRRFRDASIQSTKPVVDFDSLEYWRDGAEEVIDLEVINVGLGPALGLTFHVSPARHDPPASPVVEYAVARPVPYRTLRSGDSFRLRLVQPPEFALDPPARHSVLVSARYRSLYGVERRTGATISVGPGREASISVSMVPTVDWSPPSITSP
jgi:hypothetical protein